MRRRLHVARTGALRSAPDIDDPNRPLQHLARTPACSRRAARRARSGSVWRLLAVATLTACLGAMASAPATFAHAELLGTSPASGSTVATQPTEVIFKFNQNVGGHARRGARVQRRRANEVDNLDGLPSGRSRALDGRRPEARPAGRHLHRHLPGDLGRHPHRLRRPRVQHRPRRSAASKVTVAGLIGRERERQGHQDRLRRRARPRLHLDRPAARRARIPARRVAARVRGGGGPRARWSLGRARVRPANAAAAARGGRARRSSSACSASCCRARALPACRCGPR